MFIQAKDTDCKGFIQVIPDGRMYEKTCSTGTRWNPDICVCDHTYNVECKCVTV